MPRRLTPEQRIASQARRKELQRGYQQTWRERHPTGSADKQAKYRRKPEQRERDRLRERHRTDPSKKTTCRECGRPVWRAKKKPADYQPKCHACRGPWTPEKNRVLHRERRARMHGARIETVDELRVYERDGWRCYLCGRKVNRRLRYPHPRSVSLDHVVPLVEGGEHSYANTRCTHLRCNLKKNCRGGGEQLALI